jgi:hypothetical protein
MYRRTHRALAKAIRESSHHSGLSNEQALDIAERIADVCEESTPKTSTFDREAFMALSLMRQLPVAAED